MIYETDATYPAVDDTPLQVAEDGKSAYFYRHVDVPRPAVDDVSSNAFFDIFGDRICRKITLPLTTNSQINTKKQIK